MTTAHFEEITKRPAWIVRVFREGRHYGDPYDGAFVVVDVGDQRVTLKALCDPHNILPSDIAAIGGQLQLKGYRVMGYERIRADGTFHTNWWKI